MTAAPTAPPAAASAASRVRGRASHARGVAAEAACRDALQADGWRVLGLRLRTPAGEVDMAAERDGLLAIIEVKARPSLADAAHAVSAAQRRRLVSAAEILLAANPGWGAAGVRFDVLLVDGSGRVRRVADAFRVET